MGGLLLFIVAYLIGSIPFGLLITRAAGLGDIRDIGSGNIGTTNVLRTGKKHLAALTLLGDMLKGTLAVFLGLKLGGEVGSYVAAFGAFIGHLYPVWLKFKGGKGVATFLGISLCLFWQGAVVFAAVWVGTALISRYSSLSALLASTAILIATLFFKDSGLTAVYAVLVVLIFYAHRANIKRLLNKTESKIGQKG
jgi:glycerol-3-phosphate acyltransferase PlsY